MIHLPNTRICNLTVVDIIQYCIPSTTSPRVCIGSVSVVLIISITHPFTSPRPTTATGAIHVYPRWYIMVWPPCCNACDKPIVPPNPTFYITVHLRLPFGKNTSSVTGNRIVSWSVGRLPFTTTAPLRHHRLSSPLEGRVQGRSVDIGSALKILRNIKYRIIFILLHSIP